MENIEKEGKNREKGDNERNVKAKKRKHEENTKKEGRRKKKGRRKGRRARGKRNKEKGKPKDKERYGGKSFSSFDQEATAEGAGGGESLEPDPPSIGAFDDYLDMELGARILKQEEELLTSVQLGGLATGVNHAKSWSTRGTRRAR